MLGADYAVENGRYRITQDLHAARTGIPNCARRSARPASRSPRATTCSRSTAVRSRRRRTSTALFEGTAGRQTLHSRQQARRRSRGRGSSRSCRSRARTGCARARGSRTIAAWSTSSRADGSRTCGCPTPAGRATPAFTRYYLRAAGQGRRGHRRALQPGRHGRRLHRQRARSEADGLLRAARRQAVDVADRRASTGRR